RERGRPRKRHGVSRAHGHVSAVRRLERRLVRADADAVGDGDVGGGRAAADGGGEIRDDGGGAEALGGDGERRRRGARRNRDEGGNGRDGRVGRGEHEVDRRGR